eukprot:35822-Rhodomonas_salina.1
MLLRSCFDIVDPSPRDWITSTTLGNPISIGSVAELRLDAVKSITGRFLKPDSSRAEGFTTIITRLSIQGTAATGNSHSSS